MRCFRSRPIPGYRIAVVLAITEFIVNVFAEGLSEESPTSVASSGFAGFPTADDLNPSNLVPGGDSSRAVVASPLAADAPKRPGWPDYAFCVGDTIQATMMVAAIGMHSAAAKFNCRTSPNRDWCSRDIFGVLRNAAWAAQLVSSSLKTCGAKLRQCAQAISTVLRMSFTIGEAASQMASSCAQDSPTDRNLYDCGNWLERIAWVTDPLSDKTSETIDACNDHKIESNPKKIGACVGELLSLAAYIASAGLQLGYAGKVCAPSYVNTNADAPANCGIGVTSALRCFALAGAKATRAAGHCGGLNTMCGRDIGRMSAAVMGLAEWASKTHLKCGAVDVAPELCAMASSGMVKELAVITAKASDAANTCASAKLATNACGSAISKAIASVAFLSQQISEAVQACNPGYVEANGMYRCTMRMEFVSQAVGTLSYAIGNSVTDCGLGKGLPPATHPINLPRRYFT
mmetsp:Transcript_31368/g.86235  ORF Transcript_31368/g.86235 Transcript_31368/m.86235 type:complete len:461 (+) Transcript_31368:42-1424(+)